MTEKKAVETDTSSVTETVIVDEQRKVTWSYSRKKNLGNYQSEDVGIYMTDHVPKSTKNISKWVDDKSEAAFNNLKAQVWDALGLAFSYDDVGSPKLDEPVPAAPTAQVALPVPPAPAPPAGSTAPVSQPPPQAPYNPGQMPSVAQPSTYAAEPQFCKKCGNKEFWDNRLEQDQKMAEGKKIGPDYKCKSCTTGVFRPGSYDYNQNVGAGNAGGGAAMVPPVAEVQVDPSPEDNTIF